MNQNFRMLALKKIAGTLTNVVRYGLDPARQPPTNFISLGSAGAGTTVWMTADVVKPDGSFDMLINFRGLVGTQEGVSRLGLNKVVVVTAEAVGPQSENMGSKLLVQQFASADRINNIISIVTNHLKKQFPDRANTIHLGKLMISGFSGGGSVVAKLLGQRQNIKGDIVYAGILDGLHASPEGMNPILEYAKEAEENPSQKQLYISNTAVQTSGYASTTETAEYLRDKLGLKKEAPDNDGPPIQMAYTSKGRGTKIDTMYDTPAPYLLGNEAGSMGDQHVQAAKQGYPYLGYQIQKFLDSIA